MLREKKCPTAQTPQQTIVEQVHDRVRSNAFA